MLQLFLYLTPSFADGTFGFRLALMFFGIAFARSIQLCRQFRRLCLLRSQQSAIRSAKLDLFLL